MAIRLQEKRDTAANWTSNNPTLLAGEIGYVTDTGQIKVGNGSTAWTSLPYQKPQMIKNYTSAAFTGLEVGGAGVYVQPSNPEVTIAANISGVGLVSSSIWKYTGPLADVVLNNTSVGDTNWHEYELPAGAQRYGLCIFSILCAANYSFGVRPYGSTLDFTNPTSSANIIDPDIGGNGGYIMCPSAYNSGSGKFSVEYKSTNAAANFTLTLIGFI